MKKIRLTIAAMVFGALAFTSCKKDYTCTCTTSVGSVSTTNTHDLQNQTLKDANDACNHFESDASGGVGTTNCHL